MAAFFVVSVQQDYNATLDRYGAAIRTLRHSRSSGQLTVEGIDAIAYRISGTVNDTTADRSAAGTLHSEALSERFTPE